LMTSVRVSPVYSAIYFAAASSKFMGVSFALTVPWDPASIGWR